MLETKGMGVPALGVLFASLLATGCGDGDSTDNCTGGLEERSTWRLVAAAEFESQVLQEGEPIPLESCEALCDRGEPSETTLSCRDEGWSDEGIGTGGGNMSDRMRTIVCRVRAPRLCVGRRHAGVDADRAGTGPDEVAAWLVREAHSEAASVPAFELLADELARHRAPDALVAAAYKAAADEVRHAATMRCLAAERGAVGETVVTATAVSRSLFALALENAVEGCVNETFAALLAHHQAHHAATSTWRDAMANIAADETRHGELAWRIHAWACGRLDAGEVAALEVAMAHAADALVRQPGDDVSPDARATLGLPSAAGVRALAGRMHEHLWC